MRFLQFFYELNIFNSMSSFILNALTYSVFFITIKLNMLDDFNTFYNITSNNNSELYNIFVNKYKKYIFEKYNFSLEIVTEHQFNDVIEIFNTHNDITNLNDINYLDATINFLITKKEHKNVCKNLKKNIINEMVELLFNNEHFIPNTVLNLF